MNIPSPFAARQGSRNGSLTPNFCQFPIRGSRKPRSRREDGTSAYTIDEWAHRWRMSVPNYFKLQREGRGPAVTRVGRKVLITCEADEAWARDRKSQSA